MEIRILRYFEAVARLGTATAAADELLVAQPSISRQVQQLEKELGTGLFTRKGNSLVLTTAGHQFYPIAKDLISRADQARNFAKVSDARDTSSLRVMCLPETLEHLLAPMIALGVVDLTQVDVGGISACENSVRAGDADLYLGLRRPAAALDYKLLCSIHVTVQAPPDAGLSSADGMIAVKDLQNLPFVALTRDNLSRRLLEQSADAEAVDLTPTLETRMTKVAQAVAARNKIACVVSEEDPLYGLKAYRLRSDAGCLSIPIFACWDRTHYRRATIEFLAGALYDGYHQLDLPVCEFCQEQRPEQ